MWPGYIKELLVAVLAQAAQLPATIGRKLAAESLGVALSTEDLAALASQATLAALAASAAAAIPATRGVAVTPSDATDLTGVRALWVGGAGALTLTGSDDVDFVVSGVAAGTLLPIGPKKVKAATTATLIVALS